jgi:hypothetical protein
MVFNKAGLVRCEMLSEDDLENIDGMGNHLQGFEEDGDDEVAFLPRATDPSTKDRKRLEFADKVPLAERLLAE